MVGTYDQVHVIWHQTAANYRQRDVIVRLRDEPQEGGVVGAIVEQLVLVVAAIDEVVAVIRDNRA